MADQVYAYNVVMQSAATATGNGTAMSVGGLPTVGVQVEGITSATVAFEGTIDGSTWYGVQAVNVTTGAVATTTTADGLFSIPVTGLDQLRSRISVYATGTITVNGKAVAHSAGTLNDIDIVGQEDVNVAQVGGETVTADQTGRMPVSLYGKSSAAGDKELLLDSSGHPQVDVLSITAGETVIGRVGSTGATISQTPTVTAGAYTAGDVVGGLFTFANAARVSGYGGVLKNVLIVDDAGQDAELELWLFNQTFTAIADNGAWAPAEADLENLIMVVSTEDSGQGWLAAGTPSACDIEVSRRYTLTGTSLFGQLVTRGTPTFAATDDVTVKVALLTD